AGADPVDAPAPATAVESVGAATACWLGPAGAAALAAPALPSGCTAGCGFGGRAGRGGATASGPNPVIVTASADAGGLGPSISTGTPAAWAAFKPFSTVSIAGSSRRNSRIAASI